MENSDNREKIYIINSYTNTIPGQFIYLRAKLKFWNRYKGDNYSHVSISKDLKLDNMYSFARKEVDTPLDCGLIKEDIRDGVFKKNAKHSKISVMELEITEEQYKKLNNILEVCWTNKDEYGYNFLGLLWMLIFAKGLKRDNRYFCSQWVCSILQQSGVDIFNGKNPEDIRPFDFYGALSDKIIYEGSILDYPLYNMEDQEIARKRG